MSPSLKVSASVTHHISSPADFTDKMEDDGGIQGDADIPDMTCHGSVELTAAEKILKECNQRSRGKAEGSLKEGIPQVAGDVDTSLHESVGVDATSSQQKLGKSSSKRKNKQRSRGKAEEGIPQVAEDVDTSLHKSVGVDATSSQQKLGKSSSKRKNKQRSRGKAEEGISRK